MANNNQRPVGYMLLALSALITIGLNLRSPLTALPPVIQTIQHDLNLNATVSGLLTSIPVLCFGVLTPLMSLLIGRLGINRSVWFTLLGTAAGILLRAVGGFYGMLAGTLLLGGSLATGNIVSLMIIARDFRQHMNVVTGCYTSSLNIGTMLTSLATAPLAMVLGWQFALACWVWLPCVALLLWSLAERRRGQTFSHPAGKITNHPHQTEDLHISKWVILALSAAFAAHLFIYYGITAWLPPYLSSAAGMSHAFAGFVASSFQFMALAGAFGIPALTKFIAQGKMLVCIGVIWGSTVLLSMFAPTFWPVWCLTGGLAQGGGFVVVFMLIMQAAPSDDANRRLSVIVQGTGYTLSATGPVMVGYLHDVTRGWNGPWSALALLSLVLLLAGCLIELPFLRRVKAVR